jgi:hypothetical protein
MLGAPPTPKRKSFLLTFTNLMQRVVFKTARAAYLPRKREGNCSGRVVQFPGANQTSWSKPGYMETLEERIKRVLKDEVSVVPHNPAWARMFEEEKSRLLTCLPQELIRRIEHFGSTAIPNLSAKPIVDILVEVTSLEETRSKQ